MKVTKLLTPIILLIIIGLMSCDNKKRVTDKTNEDLDAAGNITNTTTDVNGDITQASYTGAASSATLRVRLYGYKAYLSTITLTQDSATNVTLISDPQQT